MAATATKIAGPSVQSAMGTTVTFSILLDSSYATGGEPIDLTSYFGYIHSATIGSTDAAADQVYKFGVVIPAADVAVSATNVLITAHHSSGADAVMNPADAEDLSTVGELTLTVLGKSYVDTTW